MFRRPGAALERTQAELIPERHLRGLLPFALKSLHEALPLFDRESAYPEEERQDRVLVGDSRVCTRLNTFGFATHDPEPLASPVALGATSRGFESPLPDQR